ncbi:MAG: thermonuclease family protein [Clostridiales bacterium]
MYTALKILLLILEVSLSIGFIYFVMKKFRESKSENKKFVIISATVILSTIVSVVTYTNLFSDKIYGAKADENSNNTPNTVNLDSNYKMVKILDCLNPDIIIVKYEDNKEEKVKLIAANFPNGMNKNSPFFRNSMSYTKSKLSNKSAWLETDTKEYDQNKNLLGYIWLQKPGDISEKEVKKKLFNAQMILDGFAQAYNYSPNMKYSHFFDSFQKESREKGNGLWNTNNVLKEEEKK